MKHDGEDDDDGGGLLTVLGICDWNIRGGMMLMTQVLLGDLANSAPFPEVVASMWWW